MGKNKWQCADVVFVAVGDENRTHLFGALHQIGHVGDDKVHPGHVVIGKLDTAVDDDDIVAAFYGHHVFADLPQPTQWNDAYVLIQIR